MLTPIPEKPNHFRLDNELGEFEHVQTKESHYWLWHYGGLVLFVGRLLMHDPDYLPRLEVGYTALSQK